MRLRDFILPDLGQSAPLPVIDLTGLGTVTPTLAATVTTTAPDGPLTDFKLTSTGSRAPSAAIVDNKAATSVANEEQSPEMVVVQSGLMLG